MTALSSRAQRAWDAGMPGFYLRDLESGRLVRGPFESWSEANLAVTYSYPLLVRDDCEVVQR